MDKIEEKDLLRLALSHLEPEDLARAAQVRKYWRDSSEELFHRHCVERFPITRHVKSAPDCTMTWQHLYSKMETNARRAEPPLRNQFKVGVELFHTHDGIERLEFSAICDLEDDDGDIDNERIARVRIHWEDGVQVTLDPNSDKFRVNWTLFRVRDWAPCASFRCGFRTQWMISSYYSEFGNCYMLCGRARHGQRDADFMKTRLLIEAKYIEGVEGATIPHAEISGTVRTHAIQLRLETPRLADSWLSSFLV